MLDIGKLILNSCAYVARYGFSSMLDIGKLIPKWPSISLTSSFSSMLDIGKLIRFKQNYHA